MKIGVIQLTSVVDYKKNLATIERLLTEAKAQNLKAVFLPECFYSMSDGVTPTPYLVDPNGGEHFENIANLAKTFGVYLLGGSAASADNNSEKFLNRNYNFDPSGNQLSHYDKINLFACNIANQDTVHNENEMYSSGKTLQLLDIDKWRIGLAICFDLRFPEMFRRYFAKGANILSISSAFTRVTGRAHWEILLRARAIENQCYVIAANQWGVHNDRVKTWGHSMIIDPWGKILANGFEGEKLISATLDLDRVAEIRKRMCVDYID